jgi:hypothetical protein
MQSRLALITFLDQHVPGLTPGYPLPTPPQGPVDPGWGVTPPVDPGYGRPGGGWSPVDPGYGHPGGGPGYPSQGLPWGPGRPTHPIATPPPPTPDNTLPPTVPPPHISLPIYLPAGEGPVDPDEARFELKYTVRYGWVLVPVGEDVAEPK